MCDTNEHKGEKLSPCNQPFCFLCMYREINTTLCALVWTSFWADPELMEPKCLLLNVLLHGKGLPGQ